VRKNIKNLNLRVYHPNGRVRIAAPLRIDDETIRLFVISRISWINKQQSRFEAQEPQSQHELLSGESHYYCGKPYVLNVIYQDSPPRVELCNNDHMDLYVRPGSDKPKREKVMIEWYRSELREQIPDLMEKWQWVTGVEVADWGVKKMKTRWFF
jgi:predicted metal-dependent hydrolase